MEHITKETGHVRQSPRSEVADEVVAYLTPLLREALTGETVNLTGSAWHLAAREYAGSLQAELWYGVADGPAHIVQTVDGSPPRCVVEVAGLLALGDPAASHEAGDLERCLAWTWLEMNE